MDDLDNTLYIYHTFNFSLCRLVDDMLVPSTFSVKAGIEIIDEGLVETAMRKIGYWLDNIATGCIVVGADNPIGLQMLLDDDNRPRLINPMMICPDEPTDHHMCVLLQAKLQALATGAFTVGMVELSSDNADGLVFTFVGVSEDHLPPMSEWITGATWFDSPWWNRDDASIFDTVAHEGTDLSVKPEWAYDLTALVAREMMPREAIVLKTDFQPRIIDEGEPGE